MTYSEARSYLQDVAAKGNLLGLDAIRILLEELGNPQDQLRFIHIAGTNGKGSVLAFLSHILSEAGYRVGVYTSPSLFFYEETISVNHIPIRREDVARLVTRIAEARSLIRDRHLPETTIFEVETAMAFQFFAEKGCDVVLLETGMGGRDDATNIVRNTTAAVFSHISMDHMQFLGNTPARIAEVKSGIMKPGCTAVSAVQLPEVTEVLEQAAADLSVSFSQVDPRQLSDVTYGLRQQTFSYRFRKNLTIRLAGTCQIQNAALALDVTDALIRLGWQIPEDAVRTGLLSTVWEGRFEVLRENPTVVIDGAHNPDAAAMLMSSVEEYFPDRRLFYIIGMFADKDYEEVLRITADRAAHIYTIQTKNSARALPYEQLAEAARRYNPAVTAVGDAAEALSMALEAAQPQDVILAFGSLSFLNEIRKIKIF